MISVQTWKAPSSTTEFIFKNASTSEFLLSWYASDGNESPKPSCLCDDKGEALKKDYQISNADGCLTSTAW